MKTISLNKSSLKALLLSMMALSISNGYGQGCTLTFDIDGGCISDNNGWVAISNISGGTSPWSIMWNTGDMTAYVSDVSNGTYTATVTDADGCVYTQSIDIDCDFTTDCQLRTQTQGGWGAPPNGNNPGMYLHNNFATCFPGGLIIGCANTLELTSAQAVTDYLPAGGKCKMLPSGNTTDPVGYKNQLAAQLVAATISVAFDACDPDFGASADLLGDAVINTGTFSGWTVQQLIDEANSYVGGCGSSYSCNQLKSALDMVNNNFVDGTTNNGNIDCKKDDPPKSLLNTDNSVSSVTLFPNPATDRLNVKLNNPSDVIVEFTLIDGTGRVLSPIIRSSQANADGIIEIPVSGHENGVYFLMVNQNGVVQMHRFIVAR